MNDLYSYNETDFLLTLFMTIAESDKRKLVSKIT